MNPSKKTWSERFEWLDARTDKILQWVINSKYTALWIAGLFIAGYFTRYYIDEAFHICGRAL